MLSRFLKWMSSELRATGKRGDVQAAEVARVVAAARLERLALYLAIRRARVERRRLEVTIRSAR